MSKKTCSNCVHWNSSDPALDGGRAVAGTCTKIKDYETVADTARDKANNRWSDDDFYGSLRHELDQEKAVVQSADVEAAKLVLRTMATFGCTEHKSLAAVPGEEK